MSVHLPNQSENGSQETAARGGSLDLPPSRPSLQPSPVPSPKRKVDLTAAVLPGLGKVATVESLDVRELKGVGASFTPNVDAAMAFHGLVYKPQGEFEAAHQILTGSLLNDSRVMSRVQRITFVPAFIWNALEVVLLPIRLTSFGQRVLLDLQKLQPKFPQFKCFIQWNEAKKRHIVHYDDQLSEPELRAIKDVRWPTREQILEALSANAFDNLGELAAANEDVKALLAAKEVE